MQWSDVSSAQNGILEEILRSLKQPGSDKGDVGHWKWAELLRRANSVMSLMCEQSECLRLVDTSNASVSGTAEYNKPSGCQRIVGVAYGNIRIFGILRSELDQNSLGGSPAWQTATGSPSTTSGGRYIDKPTSIQIVPIPSDTGTTIQIEYIAQPNPIYNNTDIPFNAQNNLYSFHDGIVQGVVARCLLEEKDYAGHSIWKSDFDKTVKRLKEYVKNMPDTLMTITILEIGSGRNISPIPPFRGF